MRIIVDERPTRRTAKPPIPAQDRTIGVPVPTPAAAFATQEKQLNCRTCKSRIAFREGDTAVVVTNAQSWAVTCPVDAVVNVFNPLSGRVTAPVV
jgi:hypothetical protein